MNTNVKTNDSLNAFYARAARRGADVELLKRGEIQSRTQVVKSIDELRELFSAGDGPEEHHSIRRGLDSSSRVLERRVHGFLYGGDDLSEADRKLVAEEFPREVTLIDMADRELAPGEVWLIATSGPPQTINLGKLTMNPGSRVEIRNTYLELTCQLLERK